MPDEQVPPRASGDPGTPWQPPAGPGEPVPGAAGGPPISAFPWPPAETTPPPGPNLGGWPQPPARRTRARAVVTGAIVALVAALISGSVGYELGLKHSRLDAAVQDFKAVASGPCPAGETQPAPLAASPAGTALLARLLPIPRGAKQVTALKQGVLSLSDYMHEVYPDNPTEQAHLVARCFQTAVHRTWVTPGGTITSVWLIQFGTRADARSYTLSVEQGDVALVPAGTAKFTVPGVADGMGLGDPTLDKYGNTLTRLLGDAGNTSIIIHVFVPAETNNAAASQVLQAQNARLSATG